MSFDKAALQELARECLVRWHCVPDGNAFFTHSSLLWPVTRDGVPAMLKLVNPDDDEAHAAVMLDYYGGQGCVRLLAAHRHAMLLERLQVVPEQPTLEATVLHGADDAATVIICDVVEKLHVRAGQPAPLHLIPFHERSETLRGYVASGQVAAADQELFATAVALAADYGAAANHTMMPLHGDIHHGNILHDARRGWLAIDPKGICGPRAYDYANTLCNPCPHGGIVARPERMARQAAIIAERAGLERRELLRLAFLHAAQCAAWSNHEPDQGYWLTCARVAAGLANIAGDG